MWNEDIDDKIWTVFVVTVMVAAGLPLLAVLIIGVIGSLIMNPVAGAWIMFCLSIGIIVGFRSDIARGFRFLKDKFNAYRSQAR